MSVFEIWPSLAQAWEATGDSQLQSSQEEAGGACWRLIKSETRVRVFWLETEGFSPSVFKVYRTPSRLAWRTFGLASRANREFTVMMEAHRLGLPVVRPRYWLEHRVLGCVRFSAIVLDAVDGTDLQSWLTSEAGDQQQRRRAAEATGRLLGRFHRAGLFSGTANPRNLLLPGGDSEKMCAIDLPYARLHGRDITGSDQAMADIGRALLLSNGRHAFADDEQEAFMLGYCEGDAEGARTLKTRLRLMSHREWKRQRFLRRLANLLSGDTRSAGRGGIYCPETGGYRRLSSEAVFLDQPVD
jgi:tRNA A-37 threonylcarbamoyl transferase component Bud32